MITNVWCGDIAYKKGARWYKFHRLILGPVVVSVQRGKPHNCRIVKDMAEAIAIVKTEWSATLGQKLEAFMVEGVGYADDKAKPNTQAE